MSSGDMIYKVPSVGTSLGALIALEQASEALIVWRSMTLLFVIETDSVGREVADWAVAVRSTHSVIP